jgi:hypothetical protein
MAINIAQQGITTVTLQGGKLLIAGLDGGCGLDVKQNNILEDMARMLGVYPDTDVIRTDTTMDAGSLHQDIDETLPQTIISNNRTE